MPVEDGSCFLKRHCGPLIISASVARMSEATSGINLEAAPAYGSAHAGYVGPASRSCAGRAEATRAQKARRGARYSHSTMLSVIADDEIVGAQDSCSSAWPRRCDEPAARCRGPEHCPEHLDLFQCAS